MARCAPVTRPTLGNESRDRRDATRCGSAQMSFARYARRGGRTAFGLFEKSSSCCIEVSRRGQPTIRTVSPRAESIRDDGWKTKGAGHRKGVRSAIFGIDQDPSIPTEAGALIARLVINPDQRPGARIADAVNATSSVCRRSASAFAPVLSPWRLDELTQAVRKIPVTPPKFDRAIRCRVALPRPVARRAIVSSGVSGVLQ